MNYNGGEANHIAVGPWGGQSGSRWDDGVYCTVTQVVITTSLTGIDSIQFEYEDKKGRLIWSDKHGGNGGGIKIDKIKLDYPNEFLISISGHYGSISEGGPTIIKSLGFESNRRKYGPFGIERGTTFSLPISDGKLVGFYGKSSWYLDSIGVYVKPLMQNVSQTQISHGVDGKVRGNEAEYYTISRPEKNKFVMENIPSHSHGVISPTQVNPRRKVVVSYGPWGGDSGVTFDDGFYTGVREIHVTRSGGLVSIRVCYDQNGMAVWGKKNGGSGGLKLDKIVFDYPYEILTHITGYYGSTILRGPTIIKSITLHTTKKSYGPFGDQQGFSFSSPTKGVIVGFHGRKGYFIDSIGVHLLEGKPLLLSQPSVHPFDMKPSEVVLGVPREAGLYAIGAWGGEGGKPWNDGVYAGVKTILLTRASEAMCSIQIEYDRNGYSVWSPQHGTPNDACTYLIKFDYPYEVLKCISGYYDSQPEDRQKRVIKSLTFHTNRGKYGAYGKETGTYFTSGKTEGGKVDGFHGRSDFFLNAIGVHMHHSLDDEALHTRNHTEKGVIKNILHRILH